MDLLAPCVAGWAALAGAGTPAPSEPARLLVVVVVDQLRPDTLERLEPWLDGGLGRFLRDGQVWKEAAHRHAATETGAGHATLSTGRWPAGHGIVGNVWTDPEGRPVYCAADPAHPLVGSTGPREGSAGRSSHHLTAPGLADHLHALDPASRCVGVAGKDRAAILGTGRAADLALWWDVAAGEGFTTSTAYAEALPEWVLAWNAGWAEAWGGLRWDSELPPDIARAGMGPDRRRGEPAGEAGTFPHPAPEGGPGPEARRRLAAWTFTSPWVDAAVVELARRAVVELDLGGDEHPDLLFVGLSGCDTVGHTFGPRSLEVADLLLRTDEALGGLFELLDERVGTGHWVAALSADHGVLPLPEALEERGIPAQRPSLAEAAARIEDLRAEASDTFGDDFLIGLAPGGLRLDRAAMEAAGVEVGRVEALAAEFFETELPWIERAFSAEEVARPGASSARDPLLRLLARAYHPERSADVLLVTRPWRLAYPVGTSHGSPWPYDRRVPLAFLGPGSPPGVRYDAAAAVDLCPTLLQRAGLAVPEGLDGRALR